jgi:hypothetical protein
MQKNHAVANEDMLTAVLWFNHCLLAIILRRNRGVFREQASLARWRCEPLT